MKMKSLTIFESSIIGFFVGAIVATYILCVDSTGGTIGQILSAVSLRPLLDLFTVPGYLSLVVDFVFYILVYVVYAAIAGFLIKKNAKMVFFVLALVIIFVLAVFFQQKGAPASSSLTANSYYAVQSIPLSQVAARQQASQQYFGNEVVGDLNGDGKPDVAFILSRSDPDKGTLYYLSAALATQNGHQGTNLVFLGNNVEPKNISITGVIIAISYVDSSSKTSTTTQYFYAHVVNGMLEQIQLAGKDSLLWGDISTDGNVQTFKPCGENDILVLDGSTTTIKLIQNELDQIASTSNATHSILSALVGTKHSTSIENASSSSYNKEFLVDTIVTFVPNSSCQ